MQWEERTGNSKIQVQSKFSLFLAVFQRRVWTAATFKYLYSTPCIWGLQGWNVIFFTFLGHFDLALMNTSTFCTHGQLVSFLLKQLFDQMKVLDRNIALENLPMGCVFRISFYNLDQVSLLWNFPYKDSNTNPIKQSVDEGKKLKWEENSQRTDHHNWTVPQTTDSVRRPREGKHHSRKQCRKGRRNSSNKNNNIVARNHKTTKQRFSSLCNTTSF